MKMGRVIASVAAMIVAAVGAGNAQAAQYMVSYTSNLDAGGTAQFSGIFTTTDTANASGFFQVTGLTGTRAGLAATLAGINSLAGNDNLFKPTANYFTSGGVAFSSGGTLYNPYFNGNSSLREFNTGTITNFVVNSVNGAVPEPATWAMMIMGFGMIGFGMRYSMRKSNAKFDLKVKRIAAGLEA